MHRHLPDRSVFGSFNDAPRDELSALRRRIAALEVERDCYLDTLLKLYAANDTKRDGSQAR